MEPTAGTCGWCRTPLDGRSDKQYCNASHRRQARRKRKQDRQRSNSLSPSGQSYGLAAEAQAADARFRSMVAADEASRVPDVQAAEWRAYSRRHGTLHPDEQAARIARGQEARSADWQQGTVRFQRTASTLAEQARTSRARQQRPVIEPPGEWDGHDELEPAQMIDGNVFRSGYRHAGAYLR